MAVLYFLRILYAIVCLSRISYTFPVIQDMIGTIQYLNKYGYIEGYTEGAMINIIKVQDAIRDFQRFVGLNETGETDSATIAMMKSPRCGVKDKIGSSGTTRKKRYTLQGSKWDRKILTYEVSNYPSKIKNKRSVRHEIARGFKVWSEVTPLKFKERKNNATIGILFGSKFHGDKCSFDRPEVLAHAFFPQYGGHIHFNDDEMWTLNEKEGYNLLQVAAHEIGHSLGLSHSTVRESLMFPYYLGYDPEFKLHADDIAAIQDLYGEPPDPSPPDLHKDPSFDTITRTEDGYTYIFKGQYYWKVLSDSLASGYPRKIVDDWPGLEGNLDASCTLENGTTFFFKGGYYWSFINKQIDTDSPRLISTGFPGIPNNLDAALAKPGVITFFKGNQFWLYIYFPLFNYYYPYPEPIRKWHYSFHLGLDAAFVGDDGRNYFFKGSHCYMNSDMYYVLGRRYYVEKKNRNQIFVYNNINHAVFYCKKWVNLRNKNVDDLPTPEAPPAPEVPPTSEVPVQDMVPCRKRVPIAYSRDQNVENLRQKIKLLQRTPIFDCR